MMSQSDDEPAFASRPPMPRILDYRTPEQFSEALRESGFLSETTEGALTDTEGLLRRAAYAPDGQLEFVDRTHSLSNLYDEDRTLRADAPEILAAQDSVRDATYKDGVPD